ncbi:MAG: hypothetical protein V9E99_01525 [Microthrixaceae bacterium]
MPGTGDREFEASAGRVRRAAPDMLAAHWRAPGFTCPNANVYPWSWLWDSCFHVLVWQALGRTDRALAELATVLSLQDPETGFVPHMGYFGDPEASVEFWGRRGASSITQPPMYGHAVAELVRDGVEVPASLVAAARSGLAFLLDHRRRSAGGLIELAHPWESGADDSLRWDDLVPGTWSPDAWRAAKGAFVTSIERSPSGAPLGNPATPVGAASFTALVAFNAAELASVTGDAALARQAVELTAALDARWDDRRRTWVDDGPTATGSGAAPTLEALLPLLVSTSETACEVAFVDLCDPAAYGAAFGPRGVRRDHPAYEPLGYWRGGTWPQLAYLVWVAARRRGRGDVAAAIASSMCRAADRSGFAEYWHPETAAPGGAVPQSWTALAAVVAAPPDHSGR